MSLNVKEKDSPNTFINEIQQQSISS